MGLDIPWAGKAQISFCDRQRRILDPYVGVSNLLLLGRGTEVRKQRRFMKETHASENSKTYATLVIALLFDATLRVSPDRSLDIL